MGFGIRGGVRCRDVEWFLFGESFFLRRTLRFLRGAWAVHERPLRDVVPVFAKGVGGSESGSEICSCRRPPLSFGHFPHEWGKPFRLSPPLDSGFRRNDVGSAGMT